MHPRLWGDFIGAFADGAVLFPLLAALAIKAGFPSVTALATAGAAYLVAAWLFRVPMAVQPLKAIAIAALATGASAAEVRVSGAFLGAACLLLALTDADALAKKVPTALVHGVQLSLGILLVFQGMTFVASPELMPIVLAAAILLVVATTWSGLPFLGLVATGGLVAAVLSPNLFGAPAAMANQTGLRPEMILSLVLPQIVLTTANSVVATADVATRYFGAAAKRVTPRRLLLSIGLGNLASGAVGGLPFCHGSGGITAHARGGAKTWRANVIIGVTLLGLALLSARDGRPLALPYPPLLLALLLSATGIFHLQLALPSWRAGEKPRLVAMAAMVCVTRNLLWVLLVGCLPDVVPRRRVHDPV